MLSVPTAREGAMRLRRVGADDFVIAADRERGHALGARGREGLCGCFHLRLRGLQVGALLFGLGDGVIHSLRPAPG